MQKNILITGASTGIGKTTAVEFAKNGYIVYAGVRNDKDALDLKNLNLANLIPIKIDVTNANDIATTVNYLSDVCKMEGLCALVNNAGVNYIAPFELSEDTKIRQLLEVNLFGMINLTRALIPLLQKFHQTQNQTAKIINIGSIGSKIGLPWEFSYHVSKFAVLGFSQSLRFELEHLGIKVCCVMPGSIQTLIFDKTIADIAKSQNNLSGANSDYYKRNLTNFDAAAERFKNYATKPEKVAEKIIKLVNTENPPLKKLVGLDAKIINALVWLGIENLMKGQFVTK